MRDRIEDHA